MSTPFRFDPRLHARRSDPLPGEIETGLPGPGKDPRGRIRLYVEIDQGVRAPARMLETHAIEWRKELVQVLPRQAVISQASFLPASKGFVMDVDAPTEHLGSVTGALDSMLGGFNR
jgi:hypothetical protein